MTDKPKWQLELNLRSKAWGLAINEKDLTLTAVHNKLNQIRYKGTETMPDFESRTDEEIIEFAEDFQARHGVKRGDAFMLLPRSQVQIQMAEFPPEAANNLEEVMEYQLGNYFPVELEEYAFFPQIVSKTDQLKVMIVALRKDYLGHCFAFIRRWGFKLAGLSLDTFGLVNGLARLQPNLVAESRIMIFRSFPAGMEMIALKKGRLSSSHYFQMPTLEEEEEWSADRLVGDLEQGFSMARMDPNEVDHYLWAGNYQAETFTYLAQDLGIPFETWNDPMEVPVPAEALIGFGAATSAVVDNLHLGMNMLPEKQRKRHQRLPVLLASGILILLALFFLLGEIKDFRSMSQQRARLEQRHSQLMARMNEVTTARLHYESSQDELALYNRFQTDKMLVKVLYAMAQDLPDDTYLTSVIIKKGNKITMQGESMDPFKTQRILSNMPFLKDVKTTNAITSGRNKDGKRRFIFKANLVLEALR